MGNGEDNGDDCLYERFRAWGVESLKPYNAFPRSLFMQWVREGGMEPAVSVNIQDLRGFKIQAHNVDWRLRFHPETQKQWKVLYCLGLLLGFTYWWLLAHS